MIRTVKREIRVLGLAKVNLNGRVDVVGVVYRGRLFMDGLLYFKAQELEKHGLPSLIRRSRHYEQIRVIVCRVEDGFNCEELWRNLGIPVIGLRGKRGFDVYGVDRDVALRILKTSSRAGCKPEALRVALRLSIALEETFKFKL